MNTVLIALGLIFFLNPVVWLWDFLPDFIGAFLVMYGIRKIVLLNEETEYLWRRMWRVALVGAAKPVLGYLFYGTEGGVKMILSIVAAAMEFIILIPAIRGILTCLDELQSRYCDPDLTTPSSKFSSLIIFLTVFTVFRLVVGFLPETAEIVSNGRFGSVIANDGRYYPSDSKWMLYILAAAVTFVPFIVAVVLVIKNFKRYRADRATPQNALAAAEAAKADDIVFWNSKKWRLERTPFIASAFLCIFLFVDGIDFLPKAVAALVITAMTVIHSKSVFERVIAVVGGAALAVSSVLANMRLSAFFSEYHSEEVSLWDEAAAADYKVITVLLIIQAALLFVTFLLMTEFIRRSKLEELKEYGFTSTIKIFKRQMLALRISTVLPLAAAVAYPILRPANPDLALPILILTGAVVVVFAVRVDFDQAREKPKSGGGSTKSIYRDEGTRAQEINFGLHNLGK